MAVVLWLIIAFVAGVIEAVTVSLVSVWLAIGAVCAAVAAYFGAESGMQCLVFVVTSLILLILTAPLCKKFRVQKNVPTNADMLIGAFAVVTEDIEPVTGNGEVKVNGLRWSAKTGDGSRIEKNEIVKIEEIIGAHLVVSKSDNKEVL